MNLIINSSVSLFLSEKTLFFKKRYSKNYNILLNICQGGNAPKKTIGYSLLNIFALQKFLN